MTLGVQRRGATLCRLCVVALVADRCFGALLRATGRTERDMTQLLPERTVELPAEERQS